MKQFAFPVGVLGFALLLGGLLFYENACERSAPPPSEHRERVSDAPEGLDSPNAQRWIQGQPRHWRVCLLQQE
jgi:hypothetical protein